MILFRYKDPPEYDLEISPLQRAFLKEYTSDSDVVHTSQFTYLANCGAVLNDHLSTWENQLVMDR